MKIITGIINRSMAAGSRAVTRIPNSIMVRILSLLSLIKVSEKRISENLAINKAVLAEASKKSGFFRPGHFIENQAEWESVRFGLSTMKYSGCEIMAVYNTLLDLSRQVTAKHMTEPDNQITAEHLAEPSSQMTAEHMAELISEFERKGSERRGKWGCSPRSIHKYFVRHGYSTAMTTTTDPGIINAIGTNHDAIIITAYNDRNDIRRMIHTVCVTKNADGTYTLHNAYRRAAGNYTAYGGESPLKDLCDVIAAISQGQAASICVIGVSLPPAKEKESMNSTPG